MTPRTWKGVDLDGTLAYYDEWQGVEHIGEPIPAMLERVKRWLAKGEIVKILTARVAGPDADVARHYIEQWCLKHLGQILEVTCSKDLAMSEIWDDKAVQVKLNTGERADGLEDTHETRVQLRLPRLQTYLADEEVGEVFEEYVAEASRRDPLSYKSPSMVDLEKAIRGRQYVGIYYADDEAGVLGGFRLLEPLAYGTGYRMPGTGKVIHYDRHYLRGFVIRDTQKDPVTQYRDKFVKRKSVSLSKRVPYFRLFRVDRIREWRPLPFHFQNPRELYNPKDRGMGQVLISVQLADLKRPQVSTRD